VHGKDRLVKFLNFLFCTFENVYLHGKDRLVKYIFFLLIFGTFENVCLHGKDRLVKNVVQTSDVSPNKKRDVSEFFSIQV